MRTPPHRTAAVPPRRQATAGKAAKAWKAGTAGFWFAVALASGWVAPTVAPAETTRLGTATGAWFADRELREIVEAPLHVVLPDDATGSCSLELAFVRSPHSKRVEFHAVVVGFGGARTGLLAVDDAPRDRWQDARVPLPAGKGRALSLEIRHDAGGGFWARPRLDCPEDDRSKARPHVVIISLDTLRADRIGRYGGPDALSPSIDRIADAGVLFERAYAPYPNTLASHASLFTGLYPSEHGLLPFGEVKLAAGSKTLAEAFAAQGYRTAGFTENGFVSSAYGFGQGFDRYHDGPEREPTERFDGAVEATFDRALAWLEAPSHSPFFLFVHSYEVHAPYDPPRDEIARLLSLRHIRDSGRYASRFTPKWMNQFIAGRLELSPEERNQVEALYDAEVRGLDAQVGRLDRFLAERGLAEKTLVVLVSDHGEAFFEHDALGHGRSVHREEVHVPMVFKWPGMLAPGTRVSHPVSLIDIAPTVAELVGFESGPEGNHARSQVSGMRGRAAPTSVRPVLSELALRSGRCDARAPERGDCSVRKIAIRDGKTSFIYDVDARTSELYDVTSDPNERSNVATERPALRERMSRSADSWYERLQRSEPKAEATAEGHEVSPKLEEALKALGYVE